MKIFDCSIDEKGIITIDDFNRYNETVTLSDSNNLLLHEKKSTGFIIFREDNTPIYISNTQQDLKDTISSLSNTLEQLINLCSVNVVKTPNTPATPLSSDIKQQLTDIKSDLDNYKLT